jgi:hypothetical protein
VLEATPTPTPEHHSHWVGKCLLFHKMLHTHLTKNCDTTKANLNNYDGLKDPKEHI